MSNSIQTISAVEIKDYSGRVHYTLSAGNPDVSRLVSTLMGGRADAIEMPASNYLRLDD